MMPTQPHDLAGGPFAEPHERFMQADAAPVDIGALRASDYSIRERERGRRAFVMRTLDEQRSLAAFSRTLTDLCEIGESIDVIGTMTRIVRDEALHVQLCGQVVDALGGWPGNAPEPRWIKTPTGMTARQRVIDAVLGSMCIGESVSVAMIAGVRRNTTDPVVQQLLTRMLADESVHGRFGFWWLRLRLADMSPAERRFIDGRLPRMFAAVERAARPSLEELARPYRRGPFGGMSNMDREEAFMVCLDRVIFPGFEALGIDARGAWAERPLQQVAA